MLARNIACLTLIISSLPLYGKNSYIELHRCDLLNGEHLFIEKLGNQALSKYLKFELPQEGSWEQMQNTWSDVDGLQCSNATNCEPLTHAKVQILHISQSFPFPWKYRRVKEISGNFSVEFKDGRKLNGSFDANVRKLPKGMECE